MRNLLMPLTLAAGLLSAPAWASTDDAAGELTRQFLEGYTAHDQQHLMEQVLAKLPAAQSSSSVFNANADLSPLALAVLALEAAEGSRDRVRYRISYAQQTVSSALEQASPQKPQQLSFIQVDRFSLGAALRQDAIDAYGGENVATASDFAVGPHVSWRLVTQPVMGTRADLLAVGRSDITEAQAQDLQCLSNGCLSTALELENAAAWGEMKAITPMPTLPFEVNRDGLLTPAAAITLLSQIDGQIDGEIAGESDGESDAKDERFFDAEQDQVPSEVAEQENLTPQQATAELTLPSPMVEAVIEINLGQDSALEAVLRHTLLGDDSVSATWTRLAAMPTDEDSATPSIHSATAYECQREPKFPAAGGWRL